MSRNYTACLSLYFCLAGGYGFAQEPGAGRVSESLAPPSFSLPGGFYPSSFSLTLSAPDGVTILYTLDGSEPAAGNVGGKTYTYKQSYPAQPYSSPGPLLTDEMRTNVYSAPLYITDRTGDPERFSLMSSTFDTSPSAYTPVERVKKGIVVKAKAVREGYQESASVTHTYFGFSNHYSIPVFSLTTSGENLFGYHNGIYNAGADFDTWRRDNPSPAVNGITPANYHRSGSGWEYPISVELFLPGTGERVTATNAGFRGQGRYTRAAPHKSLRLYFKSRYGSETLNYAIFPDSEESRFSRIILRNWGNDRNDQFGLFRDPVVQRVVRRLKTETQQSQPVATFINGEYWGIADAKTRFDTKYFERVYGIPEDELELLERDAMINEGSSNTHYLDMRNFIRDHDMSVADHYAYIQTLMDVEDFVDYQLTEIYFGNSDWPTNNVRYYRKKTASYQPDAPLKHDGRWRWLLYDLDFTMGNHSAEVNVNSLKRAIEHISPWASVILQKLLNNPAFRKTFIVRYQDLMNVVFNADQTNQSIRFYENIIRPEMNEYRARWPLVPTSGLTWEQHLNLMKDYSNRRQGYARTHLKEQFSLGNEQRLDVAVVNAADKAHVQVNTLHLKPGEPGIDHLVTAWNGLYYPDYPVVLTAHAQPGKRFVRWEGDVNSTDKTIEIAMNKATGIRAIFEDDTPLPVRLVAFDVSREGQAAVLRWRTAGEAGFSHFDVEHSLDGRHWNGSGTVRAKGGDGPDYYGFTAPLGDGHNYYRLKMTDLDKKVNYSEIKTLAYIMPVAGELVVAPNPADNGRLTIVPGLRPGKEYSMTVTSLTGTEVYRRDHITSPGIDLGNLAPGLYLLKLTDSDGAVGIRRVVIK